MTQDQAQNTLLHQESKTLLSLTNDIVFKLYFTKEENRELLKQFIKAMTHLTDDDLEEIEIKNSTLTKEHVREKDFIVDILLTSKRLHIMNIEMQRKGHGGFLNRIIGYNSREFSSQLSRGQKYTEVKETISLVIVDFNLLKDSDDFLEHAFFRRKNDKVFTEAQQFYIIDLTKLPQELTHTQHHWGALFKVETEEELRMLMKKSKDMKAAGEALLKLSADEEAREIIEARERSRRAFEDALHGAELKGRDEERAKAEAEKLELATKAEAEKLELATKAEAEKLELARNGLRSGVPLETISMLTGLSVEELEQLSV